MILYEYPFNERLRTYLRLESLFRRLGELIARPYPTDHHFALVTIFEIMDVAARVDLKADVLKDLDKQKALLDSYRGNPSIATELLDQIIGRMDECFAALTAQNGKTGQILTENDWLMAIRSRISIPGGTCEFDLPAYYTWQQYLPVRRRNDLMQWTQTLMPLAEALQVLLGLLRDSGAPHKVAAESGQYQQSLGQGRVYQLLRLRIDPSLGLIPEITGHRLKILIRLMRQDEEGRLKSTTDNAGFELTLCA